MDVKDDVPVDAAAVVCVDEQMETDWNMGSDANMKLKTFDQVGPDYVLHIILTSVAAN